MLMNPPLVPSNDALRVLRQLAFAGSTLAVATAGVVTINYNVHRRIRLAEQCLETKRQIRALSNGTGKELLARVIEAAESGQDFSIRAMREHKNREKRFKPTHTGQSSDKSPEEQESDSLGMRNVEIGRYPGRERTAQKIRRATVGMTSTAPAHVYGRPKRFTKPTVSWPTIGPREIEKLKTITWLGSDGPIRASAEAAEKIKKATMAMTSTAPAHVYGRPERAIPKTRPNLHGAVASWLEKTSKPSTMKDLASPLKETWPIGTSAKGISRKENEIVSSGIEKIKDTAGEAPGQTNSSAAKSNKIKGSLTAAGSQKMVTDVQPHKGRQMSELSQNLSDRGTESGVRSPSDIEKSLISTGQGTSLTDLALSTPAVGKVPSTQDPISTESATSCVSALTDRMADVHSKDTDFIPVLQGHDPQNLDVSKLAVSAGDEVAELSPASQAMLAVGLRANHAEERNDHRLEVADSSTPEVRLRGSVTGTGDISSSLQPNYQIQFEYETNQDESSFTSWPHLHPLAESDSLFEEQQFDLHDLEEETTKEEQAVSPDAQNEGRIDEEIQARHRWTPFPRSSPAPDVAGNLDPEEKLNLSRASRPAYPREETREPNEVLGKLTKEEIAVNILTAEERAKLALEIQNVFASDGSMTGQKAWVAAADSRIRCNDLIALDFLYAEFVGRGVLSISPLHHVVQTLVQWHYQRNISSARSAEILFPDPKRVCANSTKSQTRSPHRYVSGIEEGRARFTFVLRFLRGLWETRAEPAWLVFNFRRVVVAAKIREVKLVEELFALVIRFLASAGEMGSAQAVYDEMVYYHQIKPSFRSQTLLLHGYARLSDWRRVEREIESLHSQGLSRSRPHGYALMIDAVLREYATRTSADRFQNFLINAISYWGLVPTSSISTTAVQVFLSQKRYDLVREWMETLQVLFPQVETETTLFQWAIAHSWRRTGATCQGIEETIKAVAYRNPRTKLKSYAVPLIHEALSRNLAAKLDAAKAQTDPALPSCFPSNHEHNNLSSTKTLDEYLSSAYSFTAAYVSQNQKPTPEIVDLHCQAMAADRVNAFLSGTPSSEANDQICFPSLDTTSFNTDIDRTPVPLTYSVAHLKDIIPTILTTEILPQPSLISDLTIGLYRNRYGHDTRTDHVLLLWVCEKLLHAGRAFDAVHVVQKVYRHIFANNSISLELGVHGLRGGTAGEKASGLPIEFFEFWMQLAWVTRSMMQWKRVVEEVLHLSRPVWTSPVSENEGEWARRKIGRRLKITASFVFLTRFVAARGLRGRWARSKPYPEHGRKATLGEVIWLVNELEDRRDEQIGRRESVGKRLKKSRLQIYGMSAMYRKHG